MSLEYIYALGMAFLEMLFLFVVLAALCHERRTIGQSSFVVVLGLLLFFNCLVTATDIRVVLWGTTTFQLGEVVFFLPVLAAFLLIYVTDGVLAAQRILLGAVIGFLIYVYFGQITRLQCSWMGYSLSSGVSGPTLDSLLSASRTTINMLAVSHLLELLTVPMFYSKAISMGISRRHAVPLAMYGALLIGFLPALAAGIAMGAVGALFNGDFCARLIAAGILSLLLVLYLEKLESEISAQKTGALDFLFAFFGSYGRMREMETSLRGWEDRFHLVLRNTAEAIIVCDADGRITDANIAAGVWFNGGHEAAMNGEKLLSFITVAKEEPFDWQEAHFHPIYFKCSAPVRGKEEERIILASLSPIKVQDQLLLVLIGRDITEESRFAREKEQLTEQLNHSQRLESLGMLAGGIAHDFNNYVHAILGHVDVATMLDANDAEALNTHLTKIGAIAERAGKLTGQLLGFARKGKYHVVAIDVAGLFDDCRTLLGPQKLRDVDFVIPRTAEGEYVISADRQQIQQVLLNLLLNAIDAMAQNPPEREKILELRVCGAADGIPAFAPPPTQEPEPPDAEDYLCISVRDTGCGMSEETIRHLYEPFFTTKPVGVGTGMGLAMVYGIVTNHKGWLQCDSRIGEGTTFALYLPRKKE